MASTNSSNSVRVNFGQTSQKPLFNRLIANVEGEVLSSDFDRGRYATDASIYQMMPLGVVVPKTSEDLYRTLEFARAERIPVLPRGGGTSQCGQTVNNALVIDNSKYLNQILELDVEGWRCVVQPGIVLDQLNQQLKPHGLWYPVDVSTGSRATIGGMTANNSCGSRSIRYGLMRDNVISINSILANGDTLNMGPLSKVGSEKTELVQQLLLIGEQEQEELRARFPTVMRRVGGYNIDALAPDQEVINLAHLLVGSEGTLAISESIELKLSPLPEHKLLGVCHFPSFYEAMDAAQHLVKLEPTAVELIDRTMLDLSMNIPMYRSIVEKFVRGQPEALLLVEFAESDPQENLRRLTGLKHTMNELGFDWENEPKKRGGVVEAIDPAFQAAIFEVRKSGLNIMMSMKEARKPISFVEDCAVELKDLAEYTDRLTRIFEKHNTMGTWYAHASVGCLHVRPALNMRLDQDVRAMRAIAEEAFDMVLEYKGSHSGEHGDGLVRSEFHQKMFGKKVVESFTKVKKLFDPDGILNPGKIVDPPRMDDRNLFRYSPEYKVESMDTELDWSQWPGQGNGFQGAVEMCNNNGACRKLTGGSMCPSYRVTRNEKDSVRGRANSLRLAISGQLGPDAFYSDDMVDTMKLCVGCKSCKQECPTGVDMARMKIEVDAARYLHHGHSLHQKLVANLPAYAPLFARVPWLANLRNQLPGMSALLESVTGFSKHRQLPEWRKDYYQHAESGPEKGKQVILFADTFNTWFEPENLSAATRVLAAAGYRVICPQSQRSGRPLCCGRTWLTSGMVDRARREMSRLVDTLHDYAQQGVPIVGLEPSCTLGLRDELPLLLKNTRARVVAEQVVLFEEFVAEHATSLELKSLTQKALLHGHCHQKAYQQMSHVEKALGLIPGLEVEAIESSCCGMAGAFGYARDTYEVSRKMGEASLLPKVRAAETSTLIVADGTSCRQQIESDTDRQALHVARVLEMALS
ncbi:MAG: FAD-linked oxidase C-terminal domain-containing protein [Arenicellales bacterium]